MNSAQLEAQLRAATAGHVGRLKGRSLKWVRKRFLKVSNLPMPQPAHLRTDDAGFRRLSECLACIICMGERHKAEGIIQKTVREYRIAFLADFANPAHHSTGPAQPCAKHGYLPDKAIGCPDCVMFNTSVDGYSK